MYHPENYVANILFTSNTVQTETFNGTLFNISGEVTVCGNRSTIFCDGRIIFVDAGSCVWDEDGSITYSGELLDVLTRQYFNTTYTLLFN